MQYMMGLVDGAVTNKVVYLSASFGLLAGVSLVVILNLLCCAVKRGGKKLARKARKGRQQCYELEEAKYVPKRESECLTPAEEEEEEDEVCFERPEKGEEEEEKRKESGEKNEQ